MSIPAGFPKFAEESLLALLLIRSLLSLLFRWDGIVTLQSICAHVVDLAHLKQHIGLLHVTCCAARIRTTARGGRSHDHWKHPRGQCGKGQPHSGNRTEKELYGESKLQEGTKCLQRLSQILPTCTSFIHKLPVSMFQFKVSM